MTAEADAFAAAGVRVTHHRFPDTDHSFTHGKPVATARDALGMIAKHLADSA